MTKTLAYVGVLVLVAGVLLTTCVGSAWSMTLMADQEMALVSGTECVCDCDVSGTTWYYDTDTDQNPVCDGTYAGTSYTPGYARATAVAQHCTNPLHFTHYAKAFVLVEGRRTINCDPSECECDLSAEEKTAETSWVRWLSCPPWPCEDCVIGSSYAKTEGKATLTGGGQTDSDGRSDARYESGKDDAGTGLEDLDVSGTGGDGDTVKVFYKAVAEAEHYRSILCPLDFSEATAITEGGAPSVDLTNCSPE